MYSFDKYRKYFFFQLILDVSLVVAMSGIIVYVCRNSQKWDDNYFVWILALVLIFSLLRMFTLLLWTMKFFLSKKIWIGIVAIIHFFILGICVYGSLTGDFWRYFFQEPLELHPMEQNAGINANLRPTSFFIFYYKI